MEISYLNSKANISEIGAYLYLLTLNGKKILLDGNLNNPTHGGMAILIPFANRIKNGEYIFENKKYVLRKNSEGNAIHGLILDKKFSIKQNDKNFLSLNYHLIDDGYPTELNIFVNYKITERNLSVEYAIENIGNSNGPLTVGGHPYFLIDQDYTILPRFVKKCLSINKIPTGEIVDFDLNNSKEYDDCFLVGNSIKLISGYSNIEINTEGMPYFQIYTGIKNSIAIEPMSGAPDAYNNKIGLKILKPNDISYFRFDINLIT
ncbi:MAG: aldose 1-epimerase [Caldisphaera sp.]|nr:MAG: aldose 1-epimerase [Caldisphaera sp.]